MTFQDDLARYNEISGTQDLTTIGSNVDPTIQSQPIPNFQQDLSLFKSADQSQLGGVAEGLNARAKQAQAQLIDKASQVQKENQQNDETGRIDALKKQLESGKTIEQVLAESGNQQVLDQVDKEQTKKLASVIKEGSGSILPGKFTVTKGFGQKNSADVFSGGINYGTDFSAKVGTEVAVPPGQWEVVKAYSQAIKKGFIGNNENQGYGNSVLLRNTKTGEMMRFSHLSEVGVNPGQVLSGNQVFAKTGDTGNVTGPHLDLEYYNQNGKIADIFSSPYRKALFSQR